MPTTLTQIFTSHRTITLGAHAAQRHLATTTLQSTQTDPDASYIAAAYEPTQVPLTATSIAT